MKVTVARIGKAHGLKGEVVLDVRTDIPETRFVPGATFETQGGSVGTLSAGTLSVVKARGHGGKWIASFAELTDRDSAEAARGTELVIDGTESDEEDAWYLHELVGLSVVRSDGSPVGEVVDLMHLPAQDVLVVKQPSGFRAMIPFVEAFVPEVDIDAGKVIVDPPYGLLEGEEPENTGETAGSSAS